MCVYSTIADYYKDRFWPQHPMLPNDAPIIPYPATGITGTWTFPANPFTPQEIAALKEFIKQAIKTDKVFKECDCESPEKVEWLKSVGIDVAELHKEVNAEAIEWDSSIDCTGYAYDINGKLIAEVCGSGDGHFRAYIIPIDIMKKESLGIYKSVKQARAAIDRHLTKK